jgi:flagellar basal-body rod protein FlgB
MPISGIPLFSMLRTKMQWHQERQRLLAENVSNADTPKFKPRDLAPLKFDGRTPGAWAPGAGVPGAGAPSAGGAVTLARTDPGHLGASGAGSAAQFQPDRKGIFEVRPAGNAVTLEDEMMKVAANQMDYQAATTLYGRSLGLIKTAIGKR